MDRTPEKKIIPVAGATGAQGGGLEHLIGSTIEDARRRAPISDSRMPAFEQWLAQNKGRVPREGRRGFLSLPNVAEPFAAICAPWNQRSLRRGAMDLWKGTSTDPTR
ncbi:MAG: hypothetical protein ACRD3O_02890 [Terriglobia bacterium]